MISILISRDNKEFMFFLLSYTIPLPPYSCIQERPWQHTVRRWLSIHPEETPYQKITMLFP
jgi:hypothetical protein